jgi:hypothetical protein
MHCHPNNKHISAERQFRSGQRLVEELATSSGGRALRFIGAPRPPAARLQATVGDISRWRVARHLYLG